MIAAAVICSIFRSILPKDTSNGKLVYFLADVIMIVAVFLPFRSLQIPDHMGSLIDAQQEAAAYTAEGEQYTKEVVAAGIKNQLEAYILDEAATLELQLDADVELDAQTFEPLFVHLNGKISPYAKKTLEEFIEDSIGIPKEMQSWN